MTCTVGESAGQNGAAEGEKVAHREDKGCEGRHLHLVARHQGRRGQRPLVRAARGRHDRCPIPVSETMPLGDLLLDTADPFELGQGVPIALV